MDKDFSDKYKIYCRPQLGELLQTIRLDKVYHRGVQDYLYYKNDKNEEIKVIDFLGGYGSSLFGHSNPKIVDTALKYFENKTPFNSQASCRGNAALLCEKLSSIINKVTGKNYITTLASTGTESVEAAIKHAELTYYNKIKSLNDELEKTEILLTERYRNGEIAISNDFFNMVHKKMGLHPTTDFYRYIWAIKNFNYNTFKKEPAFLSLIKAFHGKTSGSVQLTHNEEYRLPFERIGIKVIFIDPSNKATLDEAIESCKIPYFWPSVNDKGEIYLKELFYINVPAFFVEPIQGEGGIRFIDKSFLKYCREVCTEYNIPLVIDEIQSGMGRTGTFLASEKLGIEGDYYLLSKSLGGGLSKIAAMMVNESLYQNEFGFIHSSTFSEDDYSSLISLKALEVLEEENLMDKCSKMGKYIKEQLSLVQKEFPNIIDEVRGDGLMIGVQFGSQEFSGSLTLQMLSAQKLFGYVIAGYLLHEHRIRVAPTMSNASVIRIEPSAYIAKEDCDLLISSFKRLCEVLYKQNVYELTRFIINEEKVFPEEEVKDYRTEYKPHNRQKKARRVALLTHIILAHQLPLFDKPFENFTAEQCREFLEKTYKVVKPQIYEKYIIESTTGEKVDLCWIGIFIDSFLIAKLMMQGEIESVHRKIEEAVNLAIDEGYHVIGFGGFTSIVTKNCTTLKTDSIALTSGNSLTVGMGLEAMFKAAENAKVDLSTSCLAAIGANGNICSIYSEIISEEVPKIILIGKPKSEDRLKKVANQIYHNALNDIKSYKLYLEGDVDQLNDIKELKGIAKVIYESKAVNKFLNGKAQTEKSNLWLYENITEELKKDPPIIITSDYKLLKNANLIVSASNSPQTIIFPEMLGKGPIIINDIAVPEDTDPSVSQTRDDVYVISGGLVKLPYNHDFKISGMPLPLGHLYACMAETILLGMIGTREHYSYGRIDKIQVKKILDIARLHGFLLGMYKTERSF